MRLAGSMRNEGGRMTGYIAEAAVPFEQQLAMPVPQNERQVPYKKTSEQQPKETAAAQEGEGEEESQAQPKETSGEKSTEKSWHFVVA